MKTPDFTWFFYSCVHFHHRNTDELAHLEMVSAIVHQLTRKTFMRSIPNSTRVGSNIKADGGEPSAFWIILLIFSYAGDNLFILGFDFLGICIDI